MALFYIYLLFFHRGISVFTRSESGNNITHSFFSLESLFNTFTNSHPTEHKILRKIAEL